MAQQVSRKRDTCCVCVFSPKYARGTGNDTQASPEVFQKMALRITEQWIRERVKLKHDHLGMMSLQMLYFLHEIVFSPFSTLDLSRSR